MADSQDRPRDTRVCNICRQNDDDVYNLGEKLEALGGRLVVHYYCLLYSCNLFQTGLENQGIKGFMIEDIQKEIKRGGHLKCIFCKRNGPTTACVEQRCRKTYHMPCAIKTTKEVILFQCKKDTFISYCQKHAEGKISKIDTLKLPDASKTSCSTCWDEIKLQDIRKSQLMFVQCGCCFYISHRECVRKFAMIAGRKHFKCSNCGCSDSEEFSTSESSQSSSQSSQSSSQSSSLSQNDISQKKDTCQHSYAENARKRGVYVPYKDADWEIDEEKFYNYDDHYKDHSTCDAETCLCPEGEEPRLYDSSHKREKWYIVICSICGGHGAHRGCITPPLPAMYVEEWKCETCRPIHRGTLKQGLVLYGEPVSDYEYPDDNCPPKRLKADPDKEDAPSALASFMNIKSTEPVVITLDDDD